MPTRFTVVFRNWIDSVEDVRTRARIRARIDRLMNGNPGRFRRLPGGVCELKLDFGLGYRVYYAERNGELIVLWGGDKSTQDRDIQTALVLARQL